MLILTRDNRDITAWMASELNLDEYTFQILQSEKAEKVQVMNPGA